MPSRMPLPARRIETKQSFLPASLRCQHGLERRVDRDAGERQVAGDLVGQQQADLAGELAELRSGRVPVAQQGQLVLDQGMVDHGNECGDRHLVQAAVAASGRSIRFLDG